MQHGKCALALCLLLSACGSDSRPSSDDDESTLDAGTPRGDAGLGDAGRARDASDGTSDARTSRDPRDAGYRWASGTDGLDLGFAEAFGSWRDQPTTSLWINAHYLKWDWLTAPGLRATVTGTDNVRVWDMFQGVQGVVVLSMSMAGNSELSQDEYDASMKRCALGQYDSYWRSFAKNAAAAGRTGQDTVVSLAHEPNGNWFPWNPGNVGVDLWKECWRSVYSAIKSESDLRVVWVISASGNTVKQGDYAVDNVWDVYPGDDYVDIIGINRYDFKVLGDEDETDWKSTCGNDQDICYAAKYAREHNKPLGVPEWSIQRDKYGYGDNPNFVAMMHKFFIDNADILAFENQFNNYGNGDWSLYPVSPVNEKSAERYRQLWKRP